MTRRPPDPATLLTVENILPGLHPLITPLAWIETLPGNPRRGRVDAIARSYDRFGQRKPLVVRVTGEVDGHPVGYTEAGNHGLQAMRDRLGWSYGAVVWVDESEHEAFAFSLADNRSHDLGAYDMNELAAGIAALSALPDLLSDAGFDGDAVARIARQTTVGALGQAQGDDEGSGMGNRGLGTPVVSTTIVFDDGVQQQVWYSFIRHLKGLYPDADTTGERLQLFIQNEVSVEG